jgi:hypothetical protein
LISNKFYKKRKATLRTQEVYTGTNKTLNPKTLKPEEYTGTK